MSVIFFDCTPMALYHNFFSTTVLKKIKKECRPLIYSCQLLSCTKASHLPWFSSIMAFRVPARTVRVQRQPCILLLPNVPNYQCKSIELLAISPLWLVLLQLFPTIRCHAFDHLKALASSCVQEGAQCKLVDSVIPSRHTPAIQNRF